jgi:hypothetical protein
MAEWLIAGKWCGRKQNHTAMQPFNRYRMLVGNAKPVRPATT